MHLSWASSLADLAAAEPACASSRAAIAALRLGAGGSWRPNVPKVLCCSEVCREGCSFIISELKRRPGPCPGGINWARLNSRHFSVGEENIVKYEGWSQRSFQKERAPRCLREFATLQLLEIPRHSWLHILTATQSAEPSYVDREFKRRTARAFRCEGLPLPWASAGTGWWPTLWRPETEFRRRSEKALSSVSCGQEFIESGLPGRRGSRWFYRHCSRPQRWISQG